MILVTGGTGFLGRHMVPTLVSEGATVRALVRSDSNSSWMEELGVERVFGDVCDQACLRPIVAGCEQVVHAAGHFRFWGDPSTFHRVNAGGTSKIVDAAVREGVRRFIYISSVVVVGAHRPTTVIDETTPCHPQDAYQRSKLEAERFVRQAFERGAMDTLILRPGAFYGPRGRYGFNRFFFEDPLRGLRLRVKNGALMTFPVFVPDVAKVVSAALGVGIAGRTYNISGPSIAHREVDRHVSLAAGISDYRLNVPVGWMVTLARLMELVASVTKREPFYPINLRHYILNDWRVDSTRARVELGFEPTPIPDGVVETIKWYRAIGF